MMDAPPPPGDPRYGEGNLPKHAGLVLSIVIITLSLLAILVAFFLRPAHAADPVTHPCKDGFVEWLNKGDVTVCYGHLVAPETWAAAQAAVDAKGPLEEKVKLLEEQVANLRVQLAETRATGVAQLEVCTNARQACEAAKAPPKCEKPGLFSSPEFSWPTGILAGLVGGVALDRGVLGCR